MRIYTVSEIEAGSPGSRWADVIEEESRRPTDTWRERDREQPRCFRDEETRQEWVAGAWAAVRGDPAISNYCERGRGYDWAASRALAERGWEAWNLAYREVIERRPVGRSAQGGARYYGRDHEAVPAAVARLKPVDIALWKALHGMQGSLLRWAIYRELGLDDAGLRFAISNEFGSVNSGSVEGVPYAGYGCRLFNDSGGKHPRFTFGGWERARALSGSDLVNRSRALLGLHAPGTLELAAAPGHMAVPGTIAKADTRMHPPVVAPTTEAPAEQLVLI